MGGVKTVIELKEMKDCVKQFGRRAVGESGG
jgi:hypothetical protein